MWMLTLIGLRGDHPPASIDGFHRFAASVDVSGVVSLIRDADPVDDPVAFRFPASMRRHYEQIRMPANLMVLSDSLCSFNPIYGQGMSVAALEALHLSRHLAERPEPFAEPVMADLATVVDVPWQMTKAADRPFVPFQSTPTLGERFLARYIDRVQRTAARDASVGTAFLRVSGLVAPRKRCSSQQRCVASFAGRGTLSRQGRVHPSSGPAPEEQEHRRVCDGRRRRGRAAAAHRGPSQRGDRLPVAFAPQALSLNPTCAGSDLSRRAAVRVSPDDKAGR
jgi:hypothetical protein